MKQLDSKAVWLFFLRFIILWWIFTLLFINVISYSLGLFWSDYMLLVLITFLPIALSFIWAKLVYHFYRYELTDAIFKKELGVIRKKYVSIPYSRIQNVDIVRNLVARILGISTLQIHTAGIGGITIGEGVLPGLSKKVAEQMRNELMKRVRQSKD